MHTFMPSLFINFTGMFYYEAWWLRPQICVYAITKFQITSYNLYTYYSISKIWVADIMFHDSFDSEFEFTKNL